MLLLLLLLLIAVFADVYIAIRLQLSFVRKNLRSKICIGFVKMRVQFSVCCQSLTETLTVCI